MSYSESAYSISMDLCCIVCVCLSAHFRFYPVKLVIYPCIPLLLPTFPKNFSQEDLRWRQETSYGHSVSEGRSSSITVRHCPAAMTCCRTDGNFKSHRLCRYNRFHEIVKNKSSCKAYLSIELLWRLENLCIRLIFVFWFGSYCVLELGRWSCWKAVFLKFKICVREQRMIWHTMLQRRRGKILCSYICGRGLRRVDILAQRKVWFSLFLRMTCHAKWVQVSTGLWDM